MMINHVASKFEKKKFQKLNVWYIYLQHVLQDTLGFQYAIWEDL